MGVRTRVDIRLRGENTRAVFAIADGTLTVEAPEAGGRSDCYIAGDATALALVLAGRSGPYSPALPGKVLAWGRKPWIGFVLPGMFHAP